MEWLRYATGRNGTAKQGLVSNASEWLSCEKTGNGGVMRRRAKERRGDTLRGNASEKQPYDWRCDRKESAGIDLRRNATDKNSSGCASEKRRMWKKRNAEAWYGSGRQKNGLAPVRYDKQRKRKAMV